MNRHRTSGGSRIPFTAALIAAALSSITTAADWPEFRGPDRAGIWEASGLIEDFSGKTDPLPHVWSTPVGAGYSGPTVSDNGVYLMDRGLPDDESSGTDIRPEGPGVERIVCVDRESGAVKWVHSYPCTYRDVGYAYGPRSSVTLQDGKAWALGMMGHLHCLDAETGGVVWSKNLAEEYEIDMPIWGLAASPLVIGDVLVVQVSASADGACLVGFDRNSGEEIWRKFDDKGSYVSPIRIEPDGDPVVIAWTGERIAGLAPADGDVHWEIATPPAKMPINVPGPAIDESGRLLFLSVFYDGSRMIQLAPDGLSAKELWHRQGFNERKTDALHSMISPPLFQDGWVYGIDSYGQMRCLDPETGDRVWENLTAVPQGRWGTGFMVQQDDRIWMLTERGELVIARLSPEGYEEIDRARMIEPTTPLKQRREGTVLWSHPAFAGTRIYARSDRELVCVELGRER